MTTITKYLPLLALALLTGCAPRPWHGYSSYQEYQSAYNAYLAGREDGNKDDDRKILLSTTTTEEDKKAARKRLALLEVPVLQSKFHEPTAVNYSSSSSAAAYYTPPASGGNTYGTPSPSLYMTPGPNTRVMSYGGGMWSGSGTTPSGNTYNCYGAYGGVSCY